MKHSGNVEAFKDDRPSRDEYFMGLAIAAASRSTCPRRSVGCVLVKDQRIISTGYNGSPSGMDHCYEDDCCMFNGSCINTIHAEINALIRARETADTMYCTDTPCINCLKAALSHNKDLRVVWLREYKDEARDAFVEFHKGKVSLSRILQFTDCYTVEEFVEYIFDKLSGVME